MDYLDTLIRDADPARDLTVPARRHIGGRPSRRPVLIGASTATALASGAATAILLLSTGTPAAYAGWTSVPTTPTSTQLSTAATSCGGIFERNPANHPTIPLSSLYAGTPVLAESWDRYTAAVYVTDGWVYTCRYSDPGAFTLASAYLYGPVQSAPGPDQLTIQYPHVDNGHFGIVSPGGSSGAGMLPMPEQYSQVPLEESYFVMGGAYGQSVFGQAGTDVSAVTFSFATGQTVVAAVQNGWYFAWWPWFTLPTSVQVTTSTGTISSPMASNGPATVQTTNNAGQTVTVPDMAARPTITCQPNTSGCVFASETDGYRYPPAWGIGTSPQTTTATGAATTTATRAATTTEARSS